MAEATLAPALPSEAEAILAKETSRVLASHMGAAEPLQYAPTKRPIAENGIAPVTITSAPAMSEPASTVCLPVINARVVRAQMAIVENATAMQILANRYAPPGAGSARFNFKRPDARSSARPQPTPKIPGIMVANTHHPKKL